MKSLLAAIQFLTIIPFPRRGAVTGEKELEGSVTFFPVVGLLIGIIVAVFDAIVGYVFPPLPASVLTVIALVGISGGLHMDGLADYADGFFSARPRDQILDIMRDSRIGVMGVIAVVSVLILKVAVLTSLSPSLRPGIIALIPLAGRCSLVPMMTLFPYARSSGGLATPFERKRSWLNVLWASVLLIVSGWFIAQWIGFAAGFVSLFAAILFSGYCFRKIGGYTGDTLGAVCEITEIIHALVAVAWLHG